MSMANLPDLPAWAALLVSLFLLAGAGLTFLGSLGLLVLPDFYSRLHAPTLGATLGTGCILIASVICFSVLESRPVVHEVLIGVFMAITMPVAFMLLARAALYRDRLAGRAEVPDPSREGRGEGEEPGAAEAAKPGGEQGGPPRREPGE